MEIPDEVFDTYFDTVDDFIDSNFGVTCRLTYPAKKTVCTNCIYDPLLKKSSGIYKSGGPISFSNGVCPYCNGVGFSESADTDTLKLRVYYEKKHWIRLPVTAELPDGSVQTIGHMADLPKILRCNNIVFNTDIEGNVEYKYKLSGEPMPHGFKRRKYFIAMWIRQ